MGGGRGGGGGGITDRDKQQRSDWLSYTRYTCVQSSRRPASNGLSSRRQSAVLFLPLCGCEWSKATGGVGPGERGGEVETDRTQHRVQQMRGHSLESDWKSKMRCCFDFLRCFACRGAAGWLWFCCAMLPGCLWCLSQLVLVIIHWPDVLNPYLRGDWWQNITP